MCSLFITRIQKVFGGQTQSLRAVNALSRCCLYGSPSLLCFFALLSCDFFKVNGGWETQTSRPSCEPCFLGLCNTTAKVDADGICRGCRFVSKPQWHRHFRRLAIVGFRQLSTIDLAGQPIALGSLILRIKQKQSWVPSHQACRGHPLPGGHCEGPFFSFFHVAWHGMTCALSAWVKLPGLQDRRAKTSNGWVQSRPHLRAPLCHMWHQLLPRWKTLKLFNMFNHLVRSPRHSILVPWGSRLIPCWRPNAIASKCWTCWERGNRAAGCGMLWSTHTNLEFQGP